MGSRLKLNLKKLGYIGCERDVSCDEKNSVPPPLTSIYHDNLQGKTPEIGINSQNSEISHSEFSFADPNLNSKKNQILHKIFETNYSKEMLKTSAKQLLKEYHREKGGELLFIY